jgi:hypothetical protein
MPFSHPWAYYSTKNGRIERGEKKGEITDNKSTNKRPAFRIPFKFFCP